MHLPRSRYHAPIGGARSDTHPSAVVTHHHFPPLAVHVCSPTPAGESVPLLLLLLLVGRPAKAKKQGPETAHPASRSQSFHNKSARSGRDRLQCKKLFLAKKSKSIFYIMTNSNKLSTYTKQTRFFFKLNMYLVSVLHLMQHIKTTISKKQVMFWWFCCPPHLDILTSLWAPTWNICNFKSVAPDSIYGQFLSTWSSTGFTLLYHARPLFYKMGSMVKVD